jgi:type II secretory pathway component GspD/PulD (secretin)
MSRSKRALFFMLVITASAFGACNNMVPIVKEPSSFAIGDVDIEGLVSEPSLADLKKIAGDTKRENIIREIDGRVTFFYYMKHRAADTGLINILKTKLGHHKVPGKIISYPHLNMLIITDAEENIESVKQILRRLDHPQNQVLIRVRVVEVTSIKKLEVGFNLFNDLTHASRALLRSFSSVAQADPSFNYSKNPSNTQQGSLFRFAVLGKDTEKWGNLSLIIRALEEAGYAKILSRPSILVTQNSSASISTGDDIPIQSGQVINNVLSITTSFKSTGVTLKVKPTFIGDESVILDVNPDVSTVVRYVPQTITAAAEVQIPIIATRKASTKVTLNNDEVLTIGGLVRHSNRVTETRVPLLGSIPYLGYIFRSTEKEEYYTELYFILHVLIIKGESPLSEYMNRGFGGTPPAKKTEPTGDEKQPKKTPKKPEDKKGGETKKPDASPKPPPPEPPPAKPKTP